MATYTKIPKPTSANYALGYQTFNTATQNQLALRDAWVLRHGAVDFQPPPANAQSRPDWTTWLGRHNDERIPRDVVYVRPRVSGASYAVDMLAGHHATAVSRFAAGAYFVRVLGLQNYWGVAAIAAGNLAVWAMARSDYPPYGSTSQPGIWVFTYSMGASSLVAVDAPFTLAVYGS